MELNEHAGLKVATILRDEIVIQPRLRYGVKVSADPDDRISLEQTTDFAGEALITLDLEEAEAVAKAIQEVVAAVRQTQREVAHGNL